MKRLIQLSIVLFPVLLIFLTSLITPKSLFASTTTRFLYDGDGVRVAKIEGEKIILYGSNFEKDLTTGKTTKYYASGKKQVAVKTNDSLSYLVNDHHGSVTLTTTQNGSINSSSSSSYYPFGEYRTLSRINSSRSYVSQIKDPETDLFFLNTRYYNQKNGVFTSPDKVYDPQVKNRYAYTAGNPISMADPSGQCVGPFVFLLPFCIQIAGIMTVDTGIALVGAGGGAIIGGILEQGVNAQVNEPGSSDYQSGVIVGQVGEASGWFMVGAGLTFLERGSISSNATTRASPSNSSKNKSSGTRGFPVDDYNPAGKPNFQRKVDGIIAEGDLLGINMSDPKAIADAYSRLTKGALRYDKNMINASMEDACAAGSGVCYHYAGLTNAALNKKGVPSSVMFVPAGNTRHALNSYYANGSWHNYVDSTGGVSTFTELQPYLNQSFRNDLYQWWRVDPGVYEYHTVNAILP